MLPRVLFGLLTVLMLVIFVVGLLAGRPHVPEPALLVLDPEGPLVEEVNVPQPADLLLGSPGAKQTRLHDLIEALHRAKSDSRVAMVLLQLDDMGSTPIPMLEELRRAIADFRTSGKRVIAYGENYSQAQYLLASAADEVWLHPLGLVGVTGLAYRRQYVKQALDNLHADVRLFRAGKYKSFGEPFVRNDMSDAAREESRVWLGQLWQDYKQDIAASRKVTPQALQNLVEHPDAAVSESGSIAAAALKAGLVDQLLDSEHARQKTAGMLGVDVNKPLPAISFREYLAATCGDDPNGKQNVGIIVASGPIVSGDEPPGSVGNDSMAALLAKARDDSSVKAVVLRIDSPGGSALASEDIRQSILNLKEAGKPVVVSMSGVAASGGYWIATAADEIWAYPATLTGSIGVFGLTGNIAGGLDKLGIHTDGVTTSPIAGQPRADVPMPPVLADVFQASVDDVYRRFIKVVSEGRKLDEAKVREIAEGRVWTGTDAARLGLVDHLGGFDEAVAAAAKRAGLEPGYGRRWLHQPEGFGEVLMERLSDDESRVLGIRLPAVATLTGSLSPMLQLFAHPGVYAWTDLNVE